MNIESNKPFRAFIAIDPNSEVLEFYHKFQQLHKSDAWAKKLRWTKPQNIHLTMRFLGNITEHQLNQIKNQLQLRLSEQTTFNITVTTPQPFPSLRKPRMIASLAHKNQQLESLATDLEEIAVDAGLSPERRGFRGHLTIGRFRNPTQRLEQLIKDTKTTEMPVDRIVIYKSDLKPTGPEYTIVAKYDLTAQQP